MKQMILTALMMTIVASASAMTYREAKERAHFLADKMAYELSLTDEQYEAAFEINLDYLMAVNHHRDLYGPHWRQRNRALQSILAGWQYDAYRAANHFYRPVYWSGNRWRWHIYRLYAAGRYYHGRPRGYGTYRGGNDCRHYAARKWHKPPKPGHGGPMRRKGRDGHKAHAPHIYNMDKGRLPSRPHKGERERRHEERRPSMHNRAFGAKHPHTGHKQEHPPRPFGRR